MYCIKCESTISEKVTNCPICGEPNMVKARLLQVEKKPLITQAEVNVYDCHLTPDLCGGDCQDSEGKCTRAVALL